MSAQKGFTLIELLIVIAIILILIAIALPNFLEAQIRAKVANVRAEMKSLETAIASYYIDHGRYPADGREVGTTGLPNGGEGNYLVWSQLTTPVKYYSEIPRDDFLPADSQLSLGGGTATRDPSNNVYRYFSANWMCIVSGNTYQNATPISEAYCKLPPGVSGKVGPERPYDPDVSFMGRWVAMSAGPDQVHNNSAHAAKVWNAKLLGGHQNHIYSATNGTKSYGDIVKWGR